MEIVKNSLSTLEKAREVYENVMSKVHDIIEGMPEGERITKAELSKKVAELSGKSVADVTPFVTLYLSHSELQSIRGKKGGWKKVPAVKDE